MNVAIICLVLTVEGRHALATRYYYIKTSMTKEYIIFFWRHLFAVLPYFHKCIYLLLPLHCPWSMTKLLVLSTTLFLDKELSLSTTMKFNICLTYNAVVWVEKHGPTLKSPITKLTLWNWDILKNQCSATHVHKACQCPLSWDRINQSILPILFLYSPFNSIIPMSQSSY
jgi:hypothetical protein